MIEAATISVNGLQGALFVIAAILFLISAVIAWFAAPRSYWPTFVALGLLLWVLTGIVNG